MRSPLQNLDQYTRLFWLMMLAHLAIWMGICVLAQPNAPLDTIEQVFWGNHWQLGYHKHPPLPAWIAAGAVWLTGGIWGAYLAGQIAVLTCIWAAWRLGRELLSPPLALLGAALLECSYYFTFMNTEINNTITVRPMWALAILCFYFALKTDQRRYWVFCGLALGLGMLSKYYAAFLAASIVGFGLFNRRARAHWRRPGPYLTLATALAVFAPHAWWMVENDFITITYALERSDTTAQVPWYDHLWHPLHFAGAQLWALAPALLVLLPLTGFRWRLRAIADEERFDRNFLAAMVLTPPAFYLATSLALGSELQSMWGAPLWTYFGVLVLYCVELRPLPVVARRLTTGWAVAAGLLIAACIARNVASPLVRGKPSRVHFPGRALAQEVRETWHTRYGTELPIVAGQWWIAANASVYSPEKPVVYGDLSPQVSPWASDRDLRRRGGIILWDMADPHDPTVEQLAERFPDAERLAPLELDWLTPADLQPARIGVAVVPPAALGANQSPPRQAEKPSAAKPL